MQSISLVALKHTSYFFFCNCQWVLCVYVEFSHVYSATVFKVYGYSISMTENYLQKGTISK